MNQYLYCGGMSLRSTQSMSFKQSNRKGERVKYKRGKRMLMTNGFIKKFKQTLSDLIDLIKRGITKDITIFKVQIIMY